MSKISHRHSWWAKFLAMLVVLRKVLGSWTTHLEYQLRVSGAFTFRNRGQRVFFPGCSLTAADPDLVLKTYEWLRERDPAVALWSDCCGMPLDKFSSGNAAARGHKRTLKQLQKLKTTELITACGNCSVQFAKLVAPGVRITSLYQILAEHDWGTAARPEPVVVHHPCSARIDKSQQESFRAIANRLHLNVANANDTKHPLPCCLVRTPRALNQRKALSEKEVFARHSPRVITYCAHCTMSFQSDIPTRHILQEVFGSQQEHWASRGKLSRFRQYWRLARMALRLRAPKQKPIEAPHPEPSSTATELAR